MAVDYLQLNREAWNARTAVHLESDFYDLKGFLAGKNMLKKIELDLLGNVSGKNLLHLQCHFGLDTLSWARLGADVTGVDLSPAAIEAAQSLATQAGLPAEFVCQDVYDFGAANSKQYDIVFVSYGALCWLPDLDKWADVVARCLRPGGELFLVEFHPFYDLLENYSYFPQSEPDVEVEGTYTENCDGAEQTMCTWPHPLSEVITALAKVGLTINTLAEFPYSPYNCFEGMEQRQPEEFYIKHRDQDVPLVYAVKATKAVV